MGTSAGPSLQGIGRGGDSNLVLEMDAHDAKSYPGEPTTNLIPYYSSRNTALVASVFSHEALWTSRADSTDVIAPDGSSTTTKAVTGTSGNSYLYTYMDDVLGVTMASNTTYTLSVWAKTTSTASTTVSLAFQDRGNGAYNTSVKTITTEWQRFSFTITTGSGATSSTLVGWFSPTHSRTFYFWGWQVEQKAYATPYVVSQHLDPTAQGPSARPASVNLMIHGNVGTGTSFEDSSPSKHTITANGNTTHSSAQSKFSGGSIYFDGAGDYLSIPDSSDWAFGAGDFTIDFWLYSTNNSQNYRGLVCHVPSPYTSATGLFIEVNVAQLRLFVRNGSGDLFTELNSSGSAIAVDTWYHVAVVRSGNTMYLYLNGSALGSASYSGTWPDWSDPLHIGFRKDQTKYFEGYMDEVRITKGTALWTSAFTPPTRRNLSAPVVDRSGNDNGGNFNTTDMTDVATYRVGEVIRPIGDAVWDFDGTDDLTTIGYHNSLNTPNAATFSVWLYPEANGEFLSRGISDNGTDPDNPRFYVYWNLQKFYFDWSKTGTDQYVTTAAGGFPANTWVNVVATVVAGGRMEIYINGGVASYETRANADSMDSPLPNTNDPIQLGGATWIPRYFAGKIASIGIYDVALTPQQIVENFNQQRNRFNI